MYLLHKALRGIITREIVKVVEETGPRKGVDETVIQSRIVWIAIVPRNDDSNDNDDDEDDDRDDGRDDPAFSTPVLGIAP